MVATALIGSAIAGAGATIFGASKAASAQTKAAQTATDAQMKMFGITREALSPFIGAGSAAIPGEQQTAGTINKLLSPNGGIDQATLESLPGYQFTQTQGLKAVQNSAAARGLGSSGAALKGAANYSTGLAQSSYGNYFNQLLGQEQTGIQQEAIGSNAAAGLGYNATNTGGQVGSNIVGAGNATAAADMAGANAVGGVGSNVAQSLLLNKLLNPGSSGGMYGTSMNPGTMGALT